MRDRKAEANELNKRRDNSADVIDNWGFVEFTDKYLSDLYTYDDLASMGETNNYVPPYCQGGGKSFDGGPNKKQIDHHKYKCELLFLLLKLPEVNFNFYPNFTQGNFTINVTLKEVFDYMYDNNLDLPEKSKFKINYKYYMEKRQEEDKNEN